MNLLSSSIFLCFQEVAEEPATDGDSDHTDSGATVNSKSACELPVITCCTLHGLSIVFNVLKIWEWAWE